MNRKTEQILKVAGTGRVWTPRELREAALDEFEGSGMPGTKFAERIGVKYSTFASWVQARRKQSGCAGRSCGRGMSAREAAQEKNIRAAKKNQTDERRGCRTRAMPEATPREKELSEALARTTAEPGRTSGELSGVRTENKLLREKIDALLARIFGAQSEKLDAAQLLLMLQGFDAPGKSPEPVAAEAPRRSTAASPPRERGPRVPAHLPVVEEVIDPEAVKACPEAWRCIGEEVTEQLDYEPARFFKRRIVRRNA